MFKTKINALAFALSTASFCLAPFSFVSCSTDSPSSVEQFVKDRTFALSIEFPWPGKEEQETMVKQGTFWLLNDATPDNHNDYKYFIGTTWSVAYYALQLKQEDTKVKNVKLKYANYTLADSSMNFVNIQNFIEIPDGNLIMAPTSESGYESKYYQYEDDPGNSPTDNWFTGDYEFVYGDFRPCINFHVMQIDFDGPNFPSSIKSGLDRINKYCVNHDGHLNTFADGWDSEIAKSSKKKYLGGYQQEFIKIQDVDQLGVSWQFDELFFPVTKVGRVVSTQEGRERQLMAVGRPKVNFKNVPTVWSKMTEFYCDPCNYWEVGPWYQANPTPDTPPIPSDWFWYGTSGSMLITEDLDIIGVYQDWWDVLNLDAPMFTLIKAVSWTWGEGTYNGKNFVEKWE